jgi:phosphoesterase RecJ-like protein
MPLNDVLVFLKSHDDFLLSSHVNADGDAISALLGMGNLLTRLGKRYRIILHDKTPNQKFTFLPQFGTIESYYPGILDGGTIHAAILLDTPGLGRIGDILTLLEGGQITEILNIDHHESNDGFGTLRFLDGRASSSSELVYRISRGLNVSFDRTLASQIYTGIMFDTGRFRFANTSSEALMICAEMVAAGAQPDLIAKAVYDEKSYESVRILGKVLLTLERHFDGRVCTMHISKEDFQPGIDVEGFVDYGIAISEVEVSVFFKEYEVNRYRLSLRSKGEVNVNQVASIFGGGGHFRAAGCFIDHPLTEAKQQLLAALQQYF